MPSKLFKAFQNVLIVILFGVIIFCGYKIIPNLIDSSNSKKEGKTITNVIASADENRFSQKAFNALKEENEDLIGYLKFDSGILSLPVVQANDNNYYLRRSFYKKYNDQGVPFMDASCTTNSQNMVIYGHNVYYDDSAMFSPLSFLTNQEKFEESQYFTFYLDGEVRKYVITDVYEIDINNSNYDFQKTDFSNQDEFDKWYQTAHERSVVSSKQTLTYNDNFITFQTCKRFYQDSRIIILAKEIERNNY